MDRQEMPTDRRSDGQTVRDRRGPAPLWVFWCLVFATVIVVADMVDGSGDDDDADSRAVPNGVCVDVCGCFVLVSHE